MTTLDWDRDSMKAERRRLRDHLTAHLQDRSLEWFSSLAMTWWSICLALPGDRLSLPSFVAFHRFGLVQSFWCGIFGVIGASRLIALYINGRWPRGPLVRMIGALFGAVTWIQVGAMLTEGNLATYHMIATGTGLYGLLAVADLLSVFRAAFDARYYSR